MQQYFYSYPLEFDNSFIPVNFGVKQVHVNNQTRPEYHFNALIRNTPHKPCSLCSYKGFEDQHYPLSKRCGVKKLSYQEILKIIDATRSCPTCALAHFINYTCVSTWQDGTSKSCSKGCIHNGHPLNYAACKHSDERPSITVSKVG